MTMKDTVLAKALWNVNGPVLDGKGLPVNPTGQIIAYAKGVIAMLKAGIVVHPAETVQGNAPPGGPLAKGSAAGGQITVLAGSVMASITAAATVSSISGSILSECNAMATYFMSAAKVSFAQGSIEGLSGETGSNPGPLGGGKGAGTGKQISNIDGKALAAAVASATGGVAVGPTNVAHYSALCNFIKQYATVSYAKGTVIGSMSGSKLTGGSASGGKIK